MPTYPVRAPDGKTYPVTGPAGASDEDLIAQVIKAYPESQFVSREQARQSRAPTVAPTAAPAPDAPEKKDYSTYKGGLDALLGGIPPALENFGKSFKHDIPEIQQKELPYLSAPENLKIAGRSAAQIALDAAQRPELAMQMGMNQLNPTEIGRQTFNAFAKKIGQEEIPASPTQMAATLITDLIGEKIASLKSPEQRKELAALSEQNLAARKVEKERLQAKAPDLQNPVLKGVSSGLESIIANAPALAVGIATKNAAIPLAMMGLGSGVSQYGDVRQRGGTPEEAALSGSLTGAIEAGTEMLPMGTIVEKFGKVGFKKFVAELIGKELVGEELATATQNAVDTAIANPTATWADYRKEFLSNAGQTALTTITQSALMGAGSSGLRQLAKQAEKLGREAPTPLPVPMQDADKVYNIGASPTPPPRAPLPTTPPPTAPTGGTPPTDNVDAQRQAHIDRYKTEYNMNQEDAERYADGYMGMEPANATDTGAPITGGPGPSVSPAVEPTPTGGPTATTAGTESGGLGPDINAPNITDVGEGNARVPLTEPTQKNTKAQTQEKAQEVLANKTNPLNERVSAAKTLINDKFRVDDDDVINKAALHLANYRTDSIETALEAARQGVAPAKLKPATDVAPTEERVQDRFQDHIDDSEAAAPRAYVRTDNLSSYSPDELQKLHDEAKQDDDTKLERALGADGAKEFKRLNTMQNSSNPQRADEGSRLFDEKFGSLTPEQERLVYGIGEPADVAQTDDIKEVLDAHRDAVQLDDDTEHLGKELVWGLRSLNTEDPNSAKSQAALVRLKAAHDAFIAQGVPMNSLVGRMADAMVGMGYKPSDAAELARSYASKIQELGKKNAPATTAAIAAPVEAVPEVVAAPEKTGDDVARVQKKTFLARMKKAPGKTARQKLFAIMAEDQAEDLKNNPPEDKSELDPQAEEIEGRAGLNKKRILEAQKAKYRGNPHDMTGVVAKELLQNSHDATRTAMENGQITQGKVNFDINGRTITISDNGIGMSGSLLAGPFLELGSTGKGTGTGQNSGGFGLAKALLLYGSDKIDVITASGGKISTLDTTGEALATAAIDEGPQPRIKVRDFTSDDYAMFPEGHGSIIQLLMPKEAVSPYGPELREVQQLPEFYSKYSGLLSGLRESPLFANTVVTYNGDTVPVGANFPFKDYRVFGRVKLPYGVAHVYVSKEKISAYGGNTHILSDGVWQFNKDIKSDNTNLPYDIYINIIPSINIKPDSAIYPFNEQRKNFSEGGEKAHEKLASLIRATYGLEQYSDSVKSFGNIQYFDPDTGQLGPIIDLVPELPQDILAKLANNGVADNSDIEIGDDGRVKVNGNEVDAESVEDLQKALPKASQLIINQSKIDANQVMVHENADLEYQDGNYNTHQVPITEFLRNIFGEKVDDFYNFMGSAFQQLRGEVVNIMGPGYVTLADEAVGISVDPTYRGVSIKVPFSGMFINPLVPEAPAGPQALFGILTTMIHELAHYKVRSHNADFPAEMQRIESALAAASYEQGFDFNGWKDRFVTRAIDAGYVDIIRTGQQLFSTADSKGDFTYGGTNYKGLRIVYRGEQFKDGEAEQVPDQRGKGSDGTANDGITEAGRDRDERVLGPAYESRKGTESGGERGGSAGSGTTPQQVAKTRKARSEGSKGLRQAQQAADAQDFMAGVSTVTAGHDGADFIPGIVDHLNQTDNAVAEVLLNHILPLSRIVDKYEARLPVLKRIQILEQQMRGMRSRMAKAFAFRLNTMSKFVGKNGKRIIGMTMHAARIDGVNPTAHVDVAEALKNDKVIKYLEGLLTDPNLTGQQKGGIKSAITKRTTQIKGVYHLWGELGKQKGGHELYIATRQYYKDMYVAIRMETTTRIDRLPIPDKDKQELKDKALKEDDDAKPDKDNPYAIPDSAYPREYFPLKRYGKFWLRVTHPEADTGREFYTFESAGQRDKFLRMRARELGENRTNANYFTRGNDVASLRTEFLKDSTMLKEMFAVIDRVLPDTSTTVDAKGVQALREELFQVWLLTLPERSIRKQFIRAQKITGFDNDIVRNFASTAQAYSTQLAKLKFGPLLQAELSAARDSITSSKDMPNTEQERLSMVVDAVKNRVNNVLNTTPQSKLGALLNTSSFISLLTGMATALIQFTSVPIRVMPKLNVKYGYAKPAMLFTRYMAIWNTLSMTEVGPDGKKHIAAPSFGNSAYVQNHPVRKRLFEAMRDDRDAFAQHSEHANLRRTALGQQGPVKNFFNAVVEAMTFPLSTMERLSREMTGLMTAELEYGKTKDETKAVNMAMDVITNALGDYGTFERPPIMQNEVGRIALQFKMYAAVQTKFLYESVESIVGESIAASLPGEKNRGARVKAAVDAAHELAGVLLMLGLIGGAGAFPMFDIVSLVVNILAGRDDDNRKERIRRNALMADDADARFRYEWLPDHLGQVPPIPGLDGKLHYWDEIAERGAVSELSGISLGPRVSLNGLWFREPREGRTWAETAQNWLIDNFAPSLSNGMNIVGAVQDWNNGDVGRGFEKALPGFFKGPVVAKRLATEGLERKSGDKMMSSNEISPTALFGQNLGFQPNEVADTQMRISRAIKNTAIADKAKSAVLKDYNQTRYNPDSTREDIQKKALKIMEYNRRYPQAPYVITNEGAEASYKAFISQRKSTIRGLPVNPKERGLVGEFFAPR